jgi:hypothetical protein
VAQYNKQAAGFIVGGGAASSISCSSMGETLMTGTRALHGFVLDVSVGYRKKR